MFPTKFDRYVEVFGGGGWVLFGRPPDQKGMEVYNDFNSNLANLFYCVKNRTWALLRELGFLPLNSRDEFTVIRDFIDKKEFDDSYLKAELELAEHNLPPPEFEEIKAIMLENAEVTDIKRAAAFFKLIRYSYGSGCTSYQHRILICDRDDFAVMEVVNGQMVFPTPEQMEEFHQGQKGGGMEMQ